MMALGELAQILGGERRHGDVTFGGVAIDSRTLAAGELFVALRGERFDGHAFVEQARAAGAAAALVSQWCDVALPQLRIADTLDGLQRLAAHWRSRFALPVVAVTGSNGKTTTKQMLAAIFAARGPVLATRGNLNNHIGVPLTLLALRGEHRTAAVEMGANHVGEIATLAALARPDVGVVTQAGDAHLEGFGSREGIARGKGELFAALDGGIAVINADDHYAALWRGLAARASRIEFGIDAQADVRAQQIEMLSDAGSRFELRTPAGTATVRLALPGRHNVMNALAAAACGIAVGVAIEDIARGLAAVEAPSGRLSWKYTPEGARVLDDSYNANPGSLRAAIEFVAQLRARSCLVLGNMAELGPDAPQLHFEAGRRARECGIGRLHAFGSLAAEAARGFGAGAQVHDDLPALIAAVRAQLDADTVVLVKGSRSARMERVVAQLIGETKGETH